MPKIIDSSAITRRIPVGSTSVAAPQIRQDGKALSDMADLFRKVRDDRDRSSLAKAENDFLLLKAQEENAYDEDKDYATIEQRYTDAVTTGLGEVAASITDPIIRNEFVARQKINIEHGRQRMEELARTKEYDFERADLAERLEETARVGISGKDFMSAYESGANLIDTNIALSEVERVKLKEDLKKRIAVGRLDMLDPENRGKEISKLEGYLPPDVIAKYKRETREALRNDRAQAVLDKMMGEGLSYADAKAQGQKIFKDADDRDEFNRRLDYENAKREQVRVENIKDVHDKYWRKVREGEMKVLDIPKEEREMMGEEGLNPLYAAQNAYATQTAMKSSDRNVLWKLHQLNQDQSPAGKVALTDYYVKNAHLLDETDFDSWGAKTAKGTTPPEVDSLLTLQQTALAKIQKQEEDYGVTYDKDSDKLLLSELNDWFINQQKLYGKVPNENEKLAKLDQLLLRFPTTGWFMGSDEKALFEMDSKDLGAAHYQAKTRNPDLYESAVKEAVGKEKLDPNSLLGKRRILEWYKYLLNKRGK